MRLDAIAFLRQLKHRPSLHPLYLLYGSEPYLIAASQDAIKRLANQHGFMEKHTIELASVSHAKAIELQKNQYTFTSERAWIELKLPLSKLSAAQKAVLHTVIKDCRDDDLICIVGGYLDKSSLNSDWVRALSQKGLIIHHSPLNQRDTERWIKQQLVILNKQATEAAIRTLANHTQGYLSATHQAINQLCLTYPETTWDHADIEAILEPMQETTCYALFNALWNKQNPTQASAVLAQLQAQHVEPAWIVFDLHQRFKQAYQTGYPKIPRACLYQWLIRLHGLDRAVKGVGDHDPWTALYDACLTQAQYLYLTAAG